MATNSFMSHFSPYLTKILNKVIKQLNKRHIMILYKIHTYVKL